MKKGTLKLLDKGLSTLEKYTLEQSSSLESSFQHLSIDLVDIRELRASLKNPALIDLEKWSTLFSALQARSVQLGETGKISEKLLLSALENYKQDAKYQNRRNAYVVVSNHK